MMFKFTINQITDENTANQIEDAKTFVKRFYRYICRHSDIVSNLMMMVRLTSKPDRFSFSSLFFVFASSIALDLECNIP